MVLAWLVPSASLPIGRPRKYRGHGKQGEASHGGWCDIHARPRIGSPDGAPHHPEANGSPASQVSALPPTQAGMNANCHCGRKVRFSIRDARRRPVSPSCRRSIHVAWWVRGVSLLLGILRGSAEPINAARATSSFESIARHLAILTPLAEQAWEGSYALQQDGFLFGVFRLSCG